MSDLSNRHEELRRVAIIAAGIAVQTPLYANEENIARRAFRIDAALQAEQVRLIEERIAAGRTTR